jgi:hypothetical protein
MSVEFTEENSASKVLYTRLTRTPERPSLVSWLIKKGIAKNDVQASRVLIGITVMCVIISLVLLGSLFFHPLQKRVDINSMYQNVAIPQ